MQVRGYFASNQLMPLAILYLWSQRFQAEMEQHHSENMELNVWIQWKMFRKFYDWKIIIYYWKGWKLWIVKKIARWKICKKNSLGALQYNFADQRINVVKPLQLYDELEAFCSSYNQQSVQRFVIYLEEDHKELLN